MPENVFQRLHEAAANHGVVTPNALVGCADRRLNPFAEFVAALLPGLYQVRNLGGCAAHYDGEVCDGAALLDMLVEKLTVLIHVGHGGCAFAAAARNLATLSRVGPFPRLVRARGVVQPTDELHSMDQLEQFLSHPRFLERVNRDEVQLLGFFITDRGDLWQYDRKTGLYIPVQPKEPQALAEQILSVAA
jgi:carbonic anhydrase